MADKWRTCVDAPDARRVFDALPEGVAWVEEDLERVLDEQQVRVWWGRSPVDLFFRSSTFHDGVARTIRDASAAVLTSLVGDDGRADRLRALG